MVRIMDGHITIRPLMSTDIPFGMMLKDIAGWNQLPSDWGRLIAFEPGGCFVARYDGRDVGTVTVTAYERRFGWVGMVLVHPDMRRRGVGTALLMHGIRYLETRGVAAVKLDATPTGKKLYQTIGFADEDLLERRQGMGETVATSADPSIVSGSAALSGLMNRLCEYDEPVFGADRSRVLHRLVCEPEVHTGVVLDPCGRILGYIMVRPGSNRHYIGPWVADDADVGRRLWHWALSRIPGVPFFTDVCLANPEVDIVVPKRLFPLQRPLVRMVRGENRYPGEPRRVFGIAGPEIG
jgi:GNAT superfamily N-acetyltransferase